MPIRKQVLTLMSDQGCGILPLDEISENKTLFEIGFDSLRYMEFIVYLEETTGFSVPDEMLDITSQTTVLQVVNSIEVITNEIIRSMGDNSL